MRQGSIATRVRAARPSAIPADLARRRFQSQRPIIISTVKRASEYGAVSVATVNGHTATTTPARAEPVTAAVRAAVALPQNALKTCTRRVGDCFGSPPQSAAKTSGNPGIRQVEGTSRPSGGSAGGWPQWRTPPMEYTPRNRRCRPSEAYSSASPVNSGGVEKTAPKRRTNAVSATEAIRRFISGKSKVSDTILGKNEVQFLTQINSQGL